MLGGQQAIPRKPSPSHSRNVSGSSLPKNGLSTPGAVESPARSPAIEPQADVPEPEAAQLSSLASPIEAGFSVQPSTYATREADIVSALSTSPENAALGLGAAEKESQKVFLASHQPQSPIADVLPRSRSESPSKGRVQELAGRFGDVSHSRRGSVQSNASRTSVQSWEKSQDNSRPTSPTKSSNLAKDQPDIRPSAEREASFRPKLPGQWESFATNAATPPEQNKELVEDKGPEPVDKASSLEEVDLAPTTAKHSVDIVDPSKTATDPLSALKAAGVAVGEALQASVGINFAPDGPSAEEQYHGDILPRPLQLSRAGSAVSTVPPTPPAKDTPEPEEKPPPPPSKEGDLEAQVKKSLPTDQKTSVVLQDGADASTDDEESDRLRNEIVASLSPQVSASGPGPNRESTVLPKEYENYWADEDHVPSLLPHDQKHQMGVQAPQAQHGTEPSFSAAQSPTQAPNDTSKPTILTRFSWEDHSLSLLPAETPVQASAALEANQQMKDNKPTTSTAEQTPEKPLEGLPDLYFGPTHGVALSKPEPMRDSELEPTPPLAADDAKPPTGPMQSDLTQEVSPASGLHVVNSALNPEAVDIPPRLSAEIHQDAKPKDPTAEDSEKKPTEPSPPNPAVSATLIQEPTAISPVTPTSDKPLGFRDIVNMKSTPERITNYNKTRDYWAQADHGLGDWIASALNSKPELVTEPYVQPRNTLAPSGTLRHRPTGSITLFGKQLGSSSHQGDAPTASSSAQTPMAPVGSTHQGSGRSASHQMQAKGKDLLHTAGVLGGKGMTGAKGLFAKGKSRFKSDKVDK